MTTNRLTTPRANVTSGIEEPDGTTVRDRTLIYPGRCAFRGTALLFSVACLLVAPAAWGKSGDLLWENRGQPEPIGIVRAIGAEGNVVVATGETGETTPACAYPFFNSCHWYVRAQDASTGATLWEDRLATAESSFGRATAVAVQGGHVFAAGWLRGAAQPFFDFVVRAYDLNLGQLLWERRVHRGAVTERAYAVVARDGQVFVAGNVASGTSRAFTLFVLDAQTGDIVWESDTAGLRLGTAGAVRVQGERVFVAGTGHIPSAPPGRMGRSLLVQAYDKGTGAMLWENEVPDAFFFINQNAVDDLAVRGDLLFVSSGILEADLSTNLFFDPMVRAYDVRTGALLWVDHMHRQAGGEANRLGLGAGRLFVYDWDCDDPLFQCFGHVRAYDPDTGTVRWEDRFTGPGGDSLIPTDAFDVHGSQVFVGASLLNAQQDQYQWTVRSYDAIRGTLLWENRSEDPGFLNGPSAMKASGGRLYVAGTNDRLDGGFDFTVRAYSAPTDNGTGSDED